MKQLLTILLPILLVPSTLRGQANEFPNPPTGQVLDNGFWLQDERRRKLEQELARYRRDYQIDVLVVIWDLPFPSDTSLEEFAQRIGENWAREELWSVILHVPDSLYRPTVVAGGLVAERVVEGAVDAALQQGTSRAMKERTPRAQIESLGLEVGEELVFLKNRRALEQRAFLAAQQSHDAQRSLRHRRMILRAVIATLVALVAVASVAVLYLLKRRAPVCHFPETRWRRRLGAKWSGGGTIVASMPTDP